MLKIKKATFLRSCHKGNFPEFNYPEFAFLGRSNVGKSSLINMLVGSRDLVKTGARPGVTQMVNFFIVNDRISFADLPGYGYAKLPREIKSRFLPLIKAYLAARSNIRIAFLLIDIRRIPDDAERDIITFLAERNIPTAIIATKCDKLPRGQKSKQAQCIADALSIDIDSIFMTSADSGEGKNELLSLIGSAAE